MKKHLIDIVLAAEDLTTVNTHLTGIGNTLQPVAFILDADQRKRLPRLGLRNESFARGVLELARQNPQLVPATIDLAAIERDVVAREQIMPVLYTLKRLTSMVEDTSTALGVDIYNGTRGLYKSMQIVAEIAGISDVVAQLGQRFAKASRETTEPEPIPAPTSPTDTAA